MVIIIETNFGNIFGAYVQIKWRSFKTGDRKFNDVIFLFLIETNNAQPKCRVIFNSLKDNPPYAESYSTRAVIFERT